MRLPLLNADTALSYLRERRLLNANSRSRVRVFSRRNHNLAVEIDGQPGWFIKQMQYDTPEVVASLQREAHCYYAAQESEALAPLQTLMPRCVQFDAANSILVLVLLDGVNAAEAHLRVGLFDPRVAEVLGRLLGTLHCATPLALPSPLRDLLLEQLPWVLKPFNHADSASRRARFLWLFEADSAIARALADLRANWQVDTLIHGDARLENFVFCRARDESAEFDARLVDWELADMGDAAWDCASVAQHYWAQWISQGPSTPETWDALACALTGFRVAYATARGLAGHDSRAAFRRVTVFTGARLIQSAYEEFVRTGAWTPTVQHLGHLARLLLTETEHALEGFERYNDAA